MENNILQGVTLSDTERRRSLRNVTLVGMVGNIMLSAVKMLAGFLGHSQAVLADGVHSLSDCLSDVAVLVGVEFWTAPADENHPHGHGRIETMVTVIVGLMLLSVAVGLVWRAGSGLHTLVGDESALPKTPGWIAFWATLTSIVSKEGLYRWTFHRGEILKSPAVKANAWHHRSDAFSSIPAALAVAGAVLRPAWVVLDPLGAIIVSIFIFQAAWKILKPALAQLIDVGVPLPERREIERLAQSVEGVREVHNVRTRYLGSSIEVDLHCLVNPDLSVRQGHDIATRVRHRLQSDGPDIEDAVVHIEPFEPESPDESRD
ncbi:MAG: cation diffusion facilitator family transporter [Candidatus Sumerlaeota bacterium]